MRNSETQLSILEGVNAKLRRGDIKAISQNTGFTREYIGNILNPVNDLFNEKIVSAAIDIITKREAEERELLRKLFPVSEKRETKVIHAY